MRLGPVLIVYANSSFPLQVCEGPNSVGDERETSTCGILQSMRRDSALFLRAQFRSESRLVFH